MQGYYVLLSIVSFIFAISESAGVLSPELHPVGFNNNVPESSDLGDGSNKRFLRATREIKKQNLASDKALFPDDNGVDAPVLNDEEERASPEKTKFVHFVEKLNVLLHGGNTKAERAAAKIARENNKSFWEYYVQPKNEIAQGRKELLRI